MARERLHQELPREGALRQEAGFAVRGGANSVGGRGREVGGRREATVQMTRRHSAVAAPRQSE